jgi:adenylosuccinate lyase
VLHEKIRRYSFEAQAAVAAGGENPLVATIAADPDFRMTAAEAAGWIDPVAFTGRSARQVDEFLDEVVEPALRGSTARAAEEPRI